MNTQDTSPPGSGANNEPINGSQQPAGQTPDRAANRAATPATQSFTDARVDELAHLAALGVGDQTGQLAATITAEQKAAENGNRKAAEQERDTTARDTVATQTKLKSIREEIKRTEKKKEDITKRQPLGIGAGLLMVFGGLVLAAFIFTENYGVGLALTDVGAFAVNSVAKGMLLSATAVTVGLAMAHGYHHLPPHWRRRAFGTAVVSLAVLFVIYLVGFTLGAKDSGAQASMGFGLSHAGAGNPGPNGPGIGSWLMLFGVLGMMPFTSMIGSISLKAGYDAATKTFDPNPDFVRLETQENIALGTLADLAVRGQKAEVRLAQFQNEEQRKIEYGMMRYTAWVSFLAGRGPKPPPVAALILALASIILSSCDEGTANGSAMQRMGGSPHGEKDSAVQRVLAISPRLDDAMRGQAASILENEAEFIASGAAMSSSVLVMDALKAQPVAELTAVQGVQKIRRRAMMPQIAAVKSFLDKVPRRSEQDAQMHIPRLAEIMGQGKLPQGTHVVLLGNPCWHTDKGADAFYSMKERYPSDGFLFEEPRESVWSTKGREQRLAGLMVHIGYPSDDVFVDESHREAIRRFLTLYFQCQGATLVSFQPSFDAAMQAAREGMTDAVMVAEADDKAQPMMIKIVRQEKEIVVPQSAAKAADAAPQQSAAKEAPAEVAKESKPEVKLDKNGNPVGAEFDLGGKDALHGQRIMIVSFDHDPDVESSPLTDALRAKGAGVERVRYPLPQPAAWKAMLDNTDQVWLWSSSESTHLPKEHLGAITDRWSSGKLGVALLADNAPYLQEASRVLAAVVPGSRITGDYKGEHVLTQRKNSKGPGFDSGSPIFTGLDKVFEGNTISTMSGKGLLPICWASDGQPLLATFQQNSSSRMLVFGGYTSFYKQFWDRAGTARLAVNMAAWLGGEDSHSQNGSLASGSDQ